MNNLTFKHIHIKNKLLIKLIVKKNILLNKTLMLKSYFTKKLINLCIIISFDLYVCFNHYENT